MYLKKLLDPETMDMMRINLSVQEKKLSAEPVCDFCGAPHPMWVYASERMSTGEMRDAWRWCACGVCSGAVDRDNWNTIENRVVQRLKKMLLVNKDSPLVLAAARYALEEFHRYAKRV